MDDSALANAILPSFLGLSLEVDLRLRFDKDNKVVSGGVALAVCNLRTDATDDLWFQLSLNQVDDLVDRLTTIGKQLRSASLLVERLQ